MYKSKYNKRIKELEEKTKNITTATLIAGLERPCTGVALSFSDIIQSPYKNLNGFVINTQECDIAFYQDMTNIIVPRKLAHFCYLNKKSLDTFFNKFNEIECTLNNIIKYLGDIPATKILYKQKEELVEAFCTILRENGLNIDKINHEKD